MMVYQVSVNTLWKLQRWPLLFASNLVGLVSARIWLVTRKTFCTSEKPTATFSYPFFKASKTMPGASVCTLKQRGFLKSMQKKEASDQPGKASGRPWSSLGKTLGCLRASLGISQQTPFSPVCQLRQQPRYLTLESDGIFQSTNFNGLLQNKNRFWPLAEEWGANAFYQQRAVNALKRRCWLLDGGANELEWGKENCHLVLSTS